MEITKRSLRAPLALGWTLRRTRELVKPWLSRSAGAGESESSPVPPRRLRARAGAAGAYAFAEGGRQAARELAALWLDEIKRVLTPGGIALLSMHGAHAFEQFRQGRMSTSWCPPAVFERGPLRSDEFVFVPYVRSFWNDGELPGVGREYGLAFAGAAHIRRSWGRSLQVVELRERALTDWQDVAVCMNCSYGGASVK